jgi:hypothetical protein
MKKIALLGMILLCTFLPLTVLASEESIDFTLYQYIDPEDIWLTGSWFLSRNLSRTINSRKSETK